MIIREYLHIIGYISAIFVIGCIIYFIIRCCCQTNNRVYIQQQPQSIYNPPPPSYQYISQRQQHQNVIQPSAPISPSAPVF